MTERETGGAFFPQPGNEGRPAGKEKEKRLPETCADGRDTGWAAALAALSILTADGALWHGMNALFAVSVLALLSAVWLYSGKKDGRVTVFGLFCLLADAAGAVSFLFSGDPLLRLCTVVMMGVLFAASLASYTGIGRYDCGTVQLFAETVRLALVVPCGHMGASLRALGYKRGADGAVRRRRAGGALLGAVCAVPALLILVPLLIRSDAAFEGLMEHTVFKNAGELFGAALFGAVLFVFLFSLLFSARKGLASGGEAPSGAALRKVDGGAATAFLGMISFFYVLYLVSQGAYFFSAFRGILPENYSVAAYARRGFFEMTAICAINLALTAAALAFTRRKEERPNRAVQALSAFVCVFSLVLVATAVSKMALYVQSFGMTRLRVLTTLFMLLLGVTFLCVLVRIFVPRFGYMRLVAAAAALLTLAAAYGNVDAWIARYNVEAYRSGALETVDTEALSQLGDAAVPYIALLTDDRDSAVADAARADLADRMYRYGEVVSDEQGRMTFTPRSDRDLRDYNRVYEAAREILCARQSELEPYLAGGVSQP